MLVGTGQAAAAQYSGHDHLSLTLIRSGEAGLLAIEMVTRATVAVIEKCVDVSKRV